MAKLFHFSSFWRETRSKLRPKNKKKSMDLLLYFDPKNGRIFLWTFANPQGFFDFSGGRSPKMRIKYQALFRFFWLITIVILILKCALKAPENDVIKTISSQISQNADTISSIISTFLSITIVILILKVALNSLHKMMYLRRYRAKLY